MIIDDTDFPKHGKHSVGVQSSIAVNSQKDQLSNNRVAVDRQSLRQPAVAYRLYLPKKWTTHKVRGRRRACQRTSASDQAGDRARSIRWACEADLPRGGLVDAAYSVNS